jgi:hypothetical protein
MTSDGGPSVARKKLWSQLAPSTQRKLRAKGATPARYNTWQKLKAKSKKGLDREEYFRGKGIRQQRKETKREAAFKAIMTKLPGANPRQVRRGVMVMKNKDLDFAIKASADKLRKKARQPAYDPDDLDLVEGEPYPVINPFWYG